MSMSSVHTRPLYLPWPETFLHPLPANPLDVVRKNNLDIYLLHLLQRSDFLQHYLSLFSVNMEAADMAFLIGPFRNFEFST